MTLGGGHEAAPPSVTSGRMHNRPMRHRLILLASSLFVAVGVSAAGAASVVVQERPLMRPALPAGTEMPMNVPEDGAVRMPYVTGGSPGVAQRINAAVWKAMLDGAADPATPGSTWTPPADKLPQGTTSLRYTARMVPAGDPRLLALAFSGESCGAYCEDFTTTHLFDLRDGRELSLGDLLTVDGFAAVGRRVDAERRRAFQKQLRELRAAVKAARKGNDDGDADERLELNRSCLAEVASAPSTPSSLVGEDVAIDGHGGLVLTKGRCSNHAMRALDDVGEIVTRISAVDLTPWLTPYGRAVLQHGGDAPAPAVDFGRRELHGQLAGAPITMTLGPLRAGAREPGRYAYDKYRTPIDLVVSRDGDQIRATEQAASQGVFDLTIAGGSLVGTWSDKDRRKRLPVIVQ